MPPVFGPLSFSLSRLWSWAVGNKIYLNNSNLSRKIIVCLFPILPKLSLSINSLLFNSEIQDKWPNIDLELLVDNNIKLPVQIQGKLVTTYDTIKGYEEEEILKSIYKLDKVKNKIIDKEIIRIINVQDKIINIIVK